MHPSTLLTALSLLFIVAPSIEAVDDTRMLCLVNQFRAQNGKKPLGLDSRMNNAASNQSNHMAKTRTMTHTGQNGSTAGQRVKNAGVNWRGVAENVAEGYESEEQVMNAWKTSPGHRANLLGEYDMFGWSKVNNGRPYWTQTFATDGSGSKNIPNCNGANSPASSNPQAGGKGAGKSMDKNETKGPRNNNGGNSSKNDMNNGNSQNRGATKGRGNRRRQGNRNNSR